MLSTCLQLMQNCEEWLTHQKVMLPFSGTWTGWRDGLRNLTKFSKGPSPAAGEG